KKFYNELGFKEVGERYLEDGIPHIVMIKTGI
ncbi:MAG: ElaA protein, partial [Maribacter sp.]